MPTSALLPMGGAVSNVAGPNWALIGDAAACVNPLNGEGIDYGLETGRLVAEMVADDPDLATAWPALLREHYGESFSIARRLAGLVTVPAAAAGPRPGRHALRLADDARPALDGQPGHRRGPRPGRADLALGRPPLARPRPAAAVLLSRAGRRGLVPLRIGAARSVPAPSALTTRVRGLEHLPWTGPVILASSHVAYPDFLPIGMRRSRRGRFVRFMCRHDIWNKWWCA